MTPAGEAEPKLVLYQETGVSSRDTGSSPDSGSAVCQNTDICSVVSSGHFIGQIFAQPDHQEGISVQITGTHELSFINEETFFGPTCLTTVSYSTVGFLPTILHLNLNVWGVDGQMISFQDC